MDCYVERSVNGRIEWLKIVDIFPESWIGAFCLIDTIPEEHQPM